MALNTATNFQFVAEGDDAAQALESIGKAIASRPWRRLRNRYV
ncbi:hypothetical protein OK016_20935 [Vibrio chagasii]|nr:hypothetical protein [Vibrio chagasii]